MSPGALPRGALRLLRRGARRRMRRAREGCIEVDLPPTEHQPSRRRRDGRLCRVPRRGVDSGVCADGSADASTDMRNDPTRGRSMRARRTETRIDSGARPTQCNDGVDCTRDACTAGPAHTWGRHALHHGHLAAVRPDGRGADSGERLCRDGVQHHDLRGGPLRDGDMLPWLVRAPPRSARTVRCAARRRVRGRLRVSRLRRSAHGNRLPRCCGTCDVRRELRWREPHMSRRHVPLRGRELPRGDGDGATSPRPAWDERLPVDAYRVDRRGLHGRSCNGLGMCTGGCTPGAPCSTAIHASSERPRARRVATCVAAGPAPAGCVVSCVGRAVRPRGGMHRKLDHVSSNTFRPARPVCRPAAAAIALRPALARARAVRRMRSSRRRRCAEARRFVRCGGAARVERNCPRTPSWKHHDLRASAACATSAEVCSGSAAGCPADSFSHRARDQGERRLVRSPEDARHGGGVSMETSGAAPACHAE